MSTAAVIPDVAAEFPVLRREFDGQPLAYLDSAATSQTPQPVIDAMTRYYTESRASVHRGVYPLAVEATDLYEGARRRIADWLRSTPEETIFTANATAAINLVAYTWGRQNIGRGDLVVLTEMEHHSNIVPWQLVCQEREAELAYVPVLDDGQLDLEALDRLLAARTQAGRVRARLKRARHDQPGPGDRRPRPRGRRRDRRRRQPGGPADPRRPARDRRRLLRLDRAQGLRADRASASCTAAASCSRRCRRSSAAGT